MARARRKNRSQPKLKERKNFEVFSLHATDPAGKRKLDKLRAERPNVQAFALHTTKPEALDSETAAEFILGHALDSQKLPELVRPNVGDAEGDFRSLGTEIVPLTGTKVVKFRQYIKGVPVYGTLVTVELDEKRECLALNATIATPNIRGHLAKISPFAALEAASDRAGYGRKKPIRTPILNYFLARNGKWHLAYIIENVRTHQQRDLAGARKRKRIPLVFDYVVDATSGRLLTELPRTPSFAAVEQQAYDDRDEPQTFRAGKKDGVVQLIDPKLNVATYDFNFRDPRAGRSRLPGKECVRPPWDENRAAVSAHVNAGKVAKYLREVLKRNNIDNKGGRIVSVVNCVVAADAEGEDGKTWKNGFWDGRQMVYGQAEFKGKLRSFASNLDVVAHELFHGVISNTARLEYLYQSGALNESYSDIFGILISNAENDDIGTWDWRMGDGLSDDFKATRSFENPASTKLDYPQPRYMKDYEDLPRNNDKGGVHINSGIHNYAAYKIMTARANGTRGSYLFKPKELAAIFYIALTQHLARQANFWASRRAVLLATRSYFRKLKPAELNKRARAVERGFAGAGIK